MEFKIYQIDAFTDTVFKGNPACVVPLDAWLPDDLLLKIAKENAVAETAFFIHRGEKIELRWFTPEIEMDLCGHATLATAHSLVTIHNYKIPELVFSTLSGDLKVRVDKDVYHLDFPARMPLEANLPNEISRALNLQPIEIHKARDYVLVYENETAVRNIKINKSILDEINLNTGGVIVTALGDTCDFVSRFFTPQATIPEDPVTGSAHCSLIPFWARRLHKNQMLALQVSERTGKLICEDKGNRVGISGQAKTYSVGKFWIDGI